jgi:hypothetical protein
MPEQAVFESYRMGHEKRASTPHPAPSSRPVDGKATFQAESVKTATTSSQPGNRISTPHRHHIHRTVRSHESARHDELHEIGRGEPPNPNATSAPSRSMARSFQDPAWSPDARDVAVPVPTWRPRRRLSQQARNRVRAESRRQRGQPSTPSPVLLRSFTSTWLMTARSLDSASAFQ